MLQPREARTSNRSKDRGVVAEGKRHVPRSNKDIDPSCGDMNKY